MKLFNMLVVRVLIGILSLTVNAEPSFNFKKGQRSTFDTQHDVKRKGAQVIELLDLKENMVVLDVLGGGGYYSELAAQKVGTGGKIYLHNNQAYMPWIEKELVARLANNRLPNVIRYDRETEDLELTPNSLDAVIFVLGYHDLYHKEKGWDIDKDSFLNQITVALKKGGKILIVDHSAKSGTGATAAQDLHRIDEAYVKKEMSDKGYHFIKQSEMLRNPKDPLDISAFKPEIRRKTDRFVLLFNKA